MSLADRIAKIKEQIPVDVKIVAISKTHPAESIRQAYQFGLRIFGENYAQEALQKMEELADLKIEWHLVGHLQSNKVKIVADRFSLIHSVNSFKLAQEISKRSTKRQKILLEVNMAGEKTKSGVTTEKLPELIEQVQKLDNIELRGLMFMPPLDLNASEQRKYFASARALRDECVQYVQKPHLLDELSMGTTHDFAAAILAGATFVRIGTAIFGRR